MRCNLINLGLKKKISYLTISDIHEFNDQNETSYIADSICAYFDDFKDTSRFAKMDIIFLAGDIFDYFKDTKNPDLVIVLVWMQRLMGFCARHGIKLRVLEGTPGHDYKQGRNFEPLAKTFGDKLDYKYVEVLSIERMEDLGIDVLYVPDEWGGSAAECKLQVQELLDRYGLEKVDIACMHGMFDFQIPDLGEHPLKHDSEWYMGIVRYFINIGHDHVFKTFNRILVQGSFDRIAHGEEGKKGGIVCHLDPGGENSFEFIENTRARIFKTITVKTKDLEKGIEQVRKVLEGLPSNAHVRISSGPSNPINSVIDNFKLAYPGMKFKKHKDKKQIEDTPDKLRETMELGSTYTSVAITSDNIVSLVMSAVETAMEPQQAELLRGELEALV